MSKMQTHFSAQVDGFHFPNYFEIKLPAKFQLPLVGAVDLNDVVFGLCGGMCFAALDYFHTHHLLPKYKSPKEIDNWLFTYLCERQIDSLQISVLIKLIDWMTSGDDALAARMLKNEIPKLRRSLDKDEPCVLCLVRTQGLNNPTHNHQVVATGYEIDDSGEWITFNLYDPNHPDDAPTLTAGLNREGFSIRQSTGEALRGFFLVPYKPLKAVAFAAQPKPSRGAVRAPEPPFRLKWPVDSRRINQAFGENPAMYRPFHLAGHEGLDFFAPTGAKIYAAFDGEVYEAKDRGAYGNQVRIRHVHNGLKFQTVYAHLEHLMVKAGQEVKAGDVLGTSDNTGNSHGSHLHLTLFIEGEKTKGYYDGIVDPWPFLEGNEPPELPSMSGIFVFTKGEVNLRDLPSASNSEVLTTLPAGERLPVLGDAGAVRKRVGKKDEWLQVQAGSGLVGYVAAWLVIDEASQVLPPSDLVVYAFDDLPIRPAPGLGLVPVGTAHPSNPLVVLGSTEAAKAKVGRSDQWLQVQAQDGTSGFVPAWLVRTTGQAAPATNLSVNPTGSVNLRSHPAVSSVILAVVTPEDALTVLGDKERAREKIGVQEQWINVRAPNGMVGWIAAWFVALPGSSPTPIEPVKTHLVVYPSPEDGVNVRPMADVTSPRICGAIRGEALTVIETDLDAARQKIGSQDQWLYIQKGNGERGWVAAWFVGLDPA
jgi:murein DD-endopeptidase MepM/ murein hydrolase activator NlpD